MLQWAILIGLVGVVLALVRQLGVLTVHLNPAAGYQLADGPAPGTLFTKRMLETLSGEEVRVGGSDAEKPSVIAFVSPGCKVCETLSPAFRTVARDYRDDATVVIAVKADRRTAESYARAHAIEDLKVVAAQSLATDLSIDSTPYALAIGANGLVVRGAVINGMEHLEELLDLAQRGVSWTASSETAPKEPSPPLAVVAAGAPTPSGSGEGDAPALPGHIPTNGAAP